MFLCCFELDLARNIFVDGTKNFGFVLFYYYICIMERKRKKSEISWIVETKYWLEHPEEMEKNTKLGLEYIHYLKDNRCSEKDAADHFGISEKELHKIIHGQIPPKDLKK